MRYAVPITTEGKFLRTLALTAAICATLAGCGGKEPTATSQQAASAAAGSSDQAAAPAEVIPTLPPSNAKWTPEELENLLAPVALYPDIVLAQVLVASTNPQEVLDAGNWLLENTSLENEDLDAAAQQAGFTPPIRALVQFPQVVDMMCQDLDWTSELGQAYIDDQAGVLDAAQRLRVQAKDVGNLTSSDKLEVDTITQDNQQVVTITPPDKEVVYVPQYDPVAVYAAPPATTTTTTVVQDDGYSTGELVTTGLLAFGAGMLVNEIFDDDDDDYYYGGGYWGRPPPYYPSYPYRPRYGDGFYPSHGYNRGNGSFNNNTVIVNPDNNYWKNRRKGNDRSPISEARRDRPELSNLNAQAAKGPRRSAPSQEGRFADVQRGNITKQPDATQRTLPKIQGSYAGAKPGGAQQARDKIAASKPKLQGSYSGAKPAAQRPAKSLADRGHTLSRDKVKQKPFANRSGGNARSSALSGSNRGSHDRAASLRGRQSMQHRASSGSHSKPQRKLRK
ncbi:MAG: DUF3300 domain-containing protein [Halioglobus sp.]|nr:DUF3300 domain-containing protein [Halioglobus sp.]